MTAKTWIVYKAEMGAEGWEERSLMPSGNLTDILAEVWDYGNQPMPKTGDRFRVYENLEEPGHGISHGRDGDWVIEGVEIFVSEEGNRIVVCRCQHQPIAQDWQAIPRGAALESDAPVATM